MTRRRRWAFYAVLILAIGIFVFVAVPVISVRTNQSYICEHTGSRKGHNEWFFGLKTDEWYKASAVETFIRQNFPSELQNKWTSYAGTQRNIYGEKLSRGHGRPGPLIQIPVEWLNEWFETLSDADKKAFYDLLLSNDTNAINVRIPQIFDTLMELNSNQAE